MNSPQAFTHTPFFPSGLRKWLRRAGWTLAWLATVLLMASALFRAYSQRRFNQTVAKAKAKGLLISDEELTSNSVPEEDNFGALPDFKPLLAFTLVETPRSQANPDGIELKFSDPEGAAFLNNLPAYTHPRPSTHQGEGGTLHLPPPQDSPFSARFSLAYLRKGALERGLLPEDSNALSDAEALLQLYKPLDPLWNRLHEGKNRSHALFPLSLSTGSTPRLKAIQKQDLYLHFHTFIPRRLASIAQAKARAYLHTARSAEALEECLLALKLSDLRASPSLNEWCARYLTLLTAQQIIHEGLTAHAWSDAQLELLEKALANRDWLSYLKEGFRVEATTIVRYTQAGNNPAGTMALWRMGVLQIKSFLGIPLTDRGDTALKSLFRACLGKSLMNLTAMRYLENMADWEQTLEKAAYRDLLAQCVRLGSAGNFLISLRDEEWEGFTRAAVRCQSGIHITRIAIALERHRIRHGDLPASLSKLSPEFLSSVPVEISNGAPLHYTRDSQKGQYMIFSTSRIRGNEDDPTLKWMGR